ncbi:MAG: hypothetical protein FWD58_01530 [Firmicutes bacterium]|nr:hypothetical protein [Bacillota bacterium]
MKKRFVTVVALIVTVCVSALSACGQKYHAVFDEGSVLDRMAGSLFPEYLFDYEGGTFVIKTKADFDVLFSEERKARYNAFDGVLLGVSDFDMDDTYATTDFAKKMLIIYVFYDHSRIYFEMKKVKRSNRKLQIEFRRIPNSNAEAAMTHRCLVVTLDKLDIDSAEFVRVD